MLRKINTLCSIFQSLVQPKAYIVTQGPTESTMPDFWRMTWQEKASCIVMVTRTFDFIRVMCVQYWPAAKNRLILLFPVKILLFPIKIILFPIKIILFPIKMLLFPVKMLLFPVKILLFPFEIILFPVIREEVYGGVGVTVESEEQLANFMIR